MYKNGFGINNLQTKPNFRVFHIFVGSLVKQTAFLLLIFISTNVEFFLSKLFEFDVKLAMNDFCDRFNFDFRGVSKQILEMFFPHL